jgi:hypothetical protein
MTLNDPHERFITDLLFDTGILNRTIDQAQQDRFFIGFGQETPRGRPREWWGGRRVAMTMEALIAFWTKPKKGFPPQNGPMSERALTIFTLTLGSHLATSMTRRPFNGTFQGELNMTEAIQRHVFDGHIGDIEWDLKGLAHCRTRFSGC